MQDPIVLLGDGATRAYNRFLDGAVRAHPGTLRISPEDIAAAPFQIAPSEEQCTLAVVLSDGSWAGVGSLERERGRTKRRHIAWIVRMYVIERYARQGVGRRILRALIERARQMPGVAKLNLTVAAHNAGALHLYESEGFVIFAREPDGFRDGESRDELSLSRVL